MSRPRVINPIENKKIYKGKQKTIKEEEEFVWTIEDEEEYEVIDLQVESNDESRKRFFD